MKLVSGRSLRTLLTERTTVDERLALLHHVIAVADAMAYAHCRNIIHRDWMAAGSWTARCSRWRRTVACWARSGGEGGPAANRFAAALSSATLASQPDSTPRRLC